MKIKKVVITKTEVAITKTEVADISFIIKVGY